MAAPRPTLGHLQKKDLTHLLIIQMAHVLNPKFNRKLIAKLDP